MDICKQTLKKVFFLVMSLKDVAKCHILYLKRNHGYCVTNILFGFELIKAWLLFKCGFFSKKNRQEVG